LNNSVKTELILIILSLYSAVFHHVIFKLHILLYCCLFTNVTDFDLNSFLICAVLCFSFSWKIEFTYPSDDTHFISHADGSHGGRIFNGVCLSVCLFIRTKSQKPLQLGSPNWHRNVSPWVWKLIYFGVRWF